MWLEPATGSRELTPLLVPYSGELVISRVSTLVKTLAMTDRSACDRNAGRIRFLQTGNELGPIAELARRDDLSNFVALRIKLTVLKSMAFLRQAYDGYGCVR